MAKALMGHLPTDPRLTAEIVSLRARVRALQTEVEELRSELQSPNRNVDLSVSRDDFDHDLAQLSHAAPALA